MFASSWNCNYYYFVLFDCLPLSNKLNSFENHPSRLMMCIYSLFPILTLSITSFSSSICSYLSLFKEKTALFFLLWFFFFFPSFFALFRDSEFSEKVELIDFLTLLLFRILPFKHSQCCRSLMSDSFDISLQQIDEWIDQVSQCNTLSENDIKLLCEKVFRTCLVASIQSYSDCSRPRRFFAKNQTFNPLVHPLRSAAMFMASSTT